MKLSALRRPLEVEKLEDRCLMAGNVTAALVGGVLQVRGDDVANAVDITNNLVGDYVLTGQTGGTGGPTTVNGSSGPVTIPGSVSVPLDIQMGNGNDEVALHNTLAWRVA